MIEAPSGGPLYILFFIFEEEVEKTG